jgi:hypothetical protein
MYRTYLILTVGMIIMALLIQGCSVKWKPIVDPRVGENYAEITRDVLECKELTKEIKNTCWTKPYWECNKKQEAVKICLANRGHSILN